MSCNYTNCKHPNIDFTTLPHAWQSSNSLRGQRGKDALCLHLEITGVGPVVKRETQTLEPIWTFMTEKKSKKYWSKNLTKSHLKFSESPMLS